MDEGQSVKGVVFGSDPRCDVRITDDPYVSARHAKAFQDRSGQVWVRDLGSTNGTWVQHGSGPKLRVYGPTRVGPGDTVWLGGRTAIPWANQL